MTDYEIKLNGYIYRRLDGAWIPPVSNNVDYLEYLKWLAAGNEPDRERSS